MRRPVLLLLVAAVLAVVIWPVRRTPSDGAEIAGPGSAPEAAASAPVLPGGELVEVAARTAAETPAAAVEPAPAVAATPSASDPTEKELAVFARTCPPGTIEGIVLRGKVPVAGGQAWLGAGSTGGLPWGSPPVWDAAVNVRRTDIGADGVFRFDDLVPETYGVGVRAPDGTSRHVFATLGEDSPSRRIRIVLGSGGVRGRVYDEHGSAAPGWEVAVYNWGNMPAGEQVIDGTATDAQGAFEFGGLTAGSYVLSAGPVANRRHPQTRTLFFELQPGEWKTVDLGSAPGGWTWTGRVLMPRGEPLRIAALTELRIESDKVSERVALSQAGSFRVRLAAGTYRLSLFAYSRSGGAGAALGEIRVRDRDLDQDVTLPRALVRVRATYRGARQDPEVALASLSTRLRGTDTSLDGLRGADGAEYFLAVPPGEYALSCQPPILGAAGGPVPVLVREQDDEVDVDVAVGDP